MAYSETPGLYFEIPAAPNPDNCQEAREYMMRIKTLAEHAGMTVYDVPYTYRIIGGPLLLSFCAAGAGDVDFYQVAGAGQPQGSIKMLIDNLPVCCPDDTEPPPTCQDLVEILQPGRVKGNLINLGENPDQDAVHEEVRRQIPGAYGNSVPSVVAEPVGSGHLDTPGAEPFTDWAFYVSATDEGKVPAFNECDLPAMGIGGLLNNSIGDQVDGGILLKTQASGHEDNIAWLFLGLVVFGGEFYIQFRQITDPTDPTLEFDPFGSVPVGRQWDQAPLRVAVNCPIRNALKGFVSEYSMHCWQPSDPGNYFHASFGVLKLRALEGELVPKTTRASWSEQGTSGSNFFKTMNAAGNGKLVLQHQSMGSQPVVFVGATGRAARPAILGMTHSATGFGGSDIASGTGWTRWASTGGLSSSIDAPICEPWMQFNPVPVSNIPGYCFGIMWDAMVMFRTNAFANDDNPEPFRFDNQWWRPLTMGGTGGPGSSGPRCSTALRVRDLLTYTGTTIFDHQFGTFEMQTTGDSIAELASITMDPPATNPLTTPVQITVRVTLTGLVPAGETVVVAVRSTRERAQFFGGGAAFLIRIPQFQFSGTVVMDINNLETLTQEELVLEAFSENKVTFVVQMVS